MTRIDWRKLLVAIVSAGLLAGCTSTSPPPLPPGNPADAGVRVPARRPGNVLVHDETTVAIQNELSRTASETKSAESMPNMPGMNNGEMKMDQAKPADVESEKKALADEMKKTSEEMKRTSDAMQQSEQKTQQNSYFTCPMHPQIHADKPGKCPICGMTLIKKEGAPPK